jgi:hypothetical protein
MRDWSSKRDRRDAVTAFLKKTITDPDVGARVLGDRQAAHQALEKEGDIDLPDDVEVICVGPSTQERDRHIVIVLPEEGTETENIDPFKYWIGTWPIYDVDPSFD